MMDTIPGYGSALEDYPGLSLPLLQDVSPNIRTYGRRGDTYNRQLLALQAILDDLQANTDRDHLLLEDMETFAAAHDPSLYPHFPQIKQTIRAERRPIDFNFLRPRYAGKYEQGEYALAVAVVMHPYAWYGNPGGRLPIVDFMIAFTHHSLYRDLLTRYRGIHRLDRDYVRYCERWGIPA